MSMSILSGCAGFPYANIKGQNPIPVHTVEAKSTDSSDDKSSVKSSGPLEGSLWKSSQSKAYLFQDPKAGQIGDIVQVQIIENAAGQKNVVTKTFKTSTVAGSTGATLGLPSNTSTNLGVNGSYADNFDGEGSTTRNNSLTAVVPARVTDVLPNGNLVLFGRREVVINSEKTLISLTGVIRPEDIASQNTISSTSMSDAKIEYIGKGVISDKNQPGWFVRLLNWFWPF
ncbi:MAG: flagellar basal body L-ring protein FlgH [Nitrospiria bacterium]